MANVKSAGAIAEKWARVTPQRSDDYRAGVMNPRTPWMAATAAAEDRYKAGVLEAANAGRFGKGVRAAWDQYWQQRSADLGTGRFAEGVAASGPAYEAGVAPYIAVIQSTVLPPRYAKGDPRNLERVKVISTALRKKKIGG